MKKRKTWVIFESTGSKRTKKSGLVLIVIPITKRRRLEEKHRISHGSKRTKESGPVLIVIPTTKRRRLEEKHRISHGDGRECFLDQKKKIF